MKKTTEKNDRRYGFLPTPGSEPGISWRRCLLLSIPALLAGLYLRAELMRVIPFAFFGADSGSYAHTMHKLWVEGGLSVQEKRRWLYPILLVPLPASPFSILSTLAFLQHLLGLASILALAWIVGHVTRFSGVWIPLVTCLYAVWPRVLWYEHEVIAEGVFLPAFLLATALAFPLSRLADRRSIFFFLLAIGSLALLKPHGKVLWVVMLGVLVFLNRKPLQWGLRNWLTIAATCLLMAISGSASQGSWLLLSSTLPLVPTQGSFPEYRKALLPIIEQSRTDFPNYVFEQTEYKKRLNCSEGSELIGVEWENLVRDERRFKKVALSLAVSGIIESPMAYSRMVAEKILLAASDCTPAEKFLAATFWSEQLQVKHLLRDPKKIPFLFGMSADRLEVEAAASAKFDYAAGHFLERVASLFTWSVAVRGAPGQQPVFGLRWIGWLALAGLLVCLIPPRTFPMLVIWAPSLAYLLFCYGIGDDVRRYLQPVEWMGWLLAAVFLDALFQFAPSKTPIAFGETHDPIA